MKTIKEIKNESKVSRTVLYKRIARLEEQKGEDYKPQYADGGVRVFPDDEAEQLINGALPIGRPKKVYREE